MDSSSEPPVSLAESPQLVFVYIGLSYTFEMIPNCAAEIVRSIVSLTDAACFLPTAFIDRIEKEWEVIKKSLCFVREGRSSRICESGPLHICVLLCKARYNVICYFNKCFQIKHSGDYYHWSVATMHIGITSQS